MQGCKPSSFPSRRSPIPVYLTVHLVKQLTAILDQAPYLVTKVTETQGNPEIAC